MSETKLATKADLKEMYDRMLPYLGGRADAGFTPVGTIIAVMGNSAPTNYLACNGQTVNIADYPELAAYFKAQFGSANYFGGDGTTTFKICDLRGEFLRGTGTNSHSGQGNGAAVGTHQDGTVQTLPFNDAINNNIVFDKISNNDYSSVLNADKILKDTGTGGAKYYTFNLDTNNKQANSAFIARPTNTSVLFCIATKNIYLNPSLDYSTDEKVVGTWIDGKPLYARSFANVEFTVTATTSTRYENGKAIFFNETEASDKVLIWAQGFVTSKTNQQDRFQFPFAMGNPLIADTNDIYGAAYVTQTVDDGIYLHYQRRDSADITNRNVTGTIYYIKTTD